MYLNDLATPICQINGNEGISLKQHPEINDLLKVIYPKTYEILSRYGMWASAARKQAPPFWQSAAITLSCNSPISFNFVFNVSEFPHNCSALVLGNVQSLMKTPNFAFAVKAATELCELWGYAFLMISLSDSDLKDEAMSAGFVPVFDGKNPHSGNFNTFYVKHISNKYTGDQ